MEGADALDGVGFAVGDGMVSLATVVVAVAVAPVVVVVAVVASEEVAASASEEVDEAVAVPPGTTHPASSQAKTQLGSVLQPNVLPDPP